MAGTTFAIENAKDLRTAPNYIRVDVQDMGDNYRAIFNWYIMDLISVSVSLNCVDTKLDNPQLEASSIEVKAYYAGDESDVESLMGTDALITYSSGYNDGSPYSPYDASYKRKFYATLDVDTLKIKNHVITIKGTDLVGTITGENKGKLYTAYGNTSYDGRTYWKVSELIDPYVQDILAPFLASTSNITYGVKIYADKTAYIDEQTNRYMFQSNKSHRKTIANLMNMFRGSNPNSPDKVAKRFVFRDAGILSAGWANDAVSAWPVTGYTPAMQTWEISYSEVADLEVERGNTVKYLKIDNPRVNPGSLGLVQGSDIDIIGGTSQVVSFSEPVLFNGFTITGGSLTVTSSILSPYAVKLTFTGSGKGKGHCNYYPIKPIYLSGEDEPNLTISTGLSGETITLDEFQGMHKMDGYIGDPWDTSKEAFTSMSWVGRALEHTLNDCGLNQPKWITFTWRGNPHMQPRDMLIFTEKDGTKNYYEIDNLTLEHKDGGLISKIKAIYKCPYTN